MVRVVNSPSAYPDLSPLQVLSSSNLSFNQVIAVDRGGNGHLGQAAADELQHGHLGRGVLHGHAVRTQPQVSAAAVDLLPCRIIQVAVHDLLRECQRPAEPAGSDCRNTFRGNFNLCLVGGVLSNEMVKVTSNDSVLRKYSLHFNVFKI